MSMFNVRCRYRTGAGWIALGPVRRQRGWCDLTACGDERVGWVAKMAHICGMECAGGGAQAVREVYLARMRERVGGMCVPQRSRPVIVGRVLLGRHLVCSSIELKALS